jgi:hypothetical protein
VLLVEAFAGRDVSAAVARCPRLLAEPSDQLAERVERCLALLARLHPSGDRHVVAVAVHEHPDLLWRCDYYQVCLRAGTTGYVRLEAASVALGPPALYARVGTAG